MIFLGGLPGLGVFILFLTALCRAELCLPNGIPEGQRLYVLNASNEQSPIRLTIFAWRSSIVTSQIAQILISEVLGYHALVTPETIFDTTAGISRLAGCESSDCQVKTSRTDVVLDTWLSPVFPFWQGFLAQNPQVAEDLGSMGYQGGDGLYIKGSVLESAANAGLALEYYKSYNMSFHQPYKYFDTLWDLPEADLEPCNGSFLGWPLEPTDSEKMKNYLDWTGDVDGVVERNGQYSANCQLPAFWMAPACRHNYTQCIPVMQNGPGYMVVLMQWSVAYGIPMALTHGTTGTNVMKAIRNQRILYYWFEPDETLLDLRHARLILPPHSAAGWLKGDFRTGGEEVYIAKLANVGLQISAPRVRTFVQKMKLEVGELLDMLATTAINSTADQKLQILGDAACQWVKTKSDIWGKWMPVKTDCSAGYGLVDVQGLPVASLAEAVDCQVCAAGRFSEVFTQDGRQTYRCQECEVGFHQSGFGQSQCIQCEAGTFAAAVGQATCSPCERGTYVSSTGATGCSSCGAEELWTTSKAVQAGGQEKWIEFEGATSAGSCHCVEGRHLSAGQCEICIEGASCPGSGVLTLLPGFYSTLGDPGAVLRCFGNSLRCPGGAPETCAEGRDPSSPACSSCLPGLQPIGEQCMPCKGGDYIKLVALTLLVLVGTGILHIVLALTDRTSGSYRSALLGAALCANQLITCAQLFVVMEQIQDITWSEPFLSFLEFFRVLSLERLLDSVKTLSCVARISPEMNFLIRNLMVPASFTIGPVVAQFTMSRTSFAKTSSWSCLLKTFGFLFLLFYISLCSSFVDPFRCNVHPNDSLTMQTAHDVFCNFSGTHLTLCWMSSLICLLPVSFLVMCTYLLWVILPRRVRVANAAFIRACSFLVLRFKPGYESFTLAFLLRNVLFVLTPMMHSSISLFVMGNLLALTAVSVAYFKPWRSDLASVVDVLVSSALLSVLLMGALTVNDSDPKPLMVLCTLRGSLIICALIMGALYSILQHIASKFRKKFAFFLSHHRTASAAYARLLRMELRQRGSQFTAFLDSDHLTDLTRLFSYVSSDTQTFVLLGTPSVLKRKWCMGELVMARIANVDTVVLSFPDFDLPDESFVRNYARLVPEIKELSMYGLGLSEVHDTLRWLSTVTNYPIASQFSKEGVVATVGQLTNTVTQEFQQGHTTEYAILADPGNMEAMATAEVMGTFLTRLIPERGQATRVFTADSNVSRTDTRLILVCSQDCFRSNHIARWLLQARVVPSCQLLPVLADERFQLPRRHGGSLQENVVCPAGIDEGAYLQVIKAVFLEVALPFIPAQSSEVDLCIRSRQVASRLYGDLKPLSTKLLIVGGAPEPEATQPEAISGTDSSNASLHLLTRQSQHVSEDVEAALRSEMVTKSF